MSITIEVPENIKALIFDCDGTLIDNLECQLEALQVAFNTFDCEFTREFLKEHTGKPLADVIDIYNDLYDVDLCADTIGSIMLNEIDKLHDKAKPVRSVCNVARRYAGQMPMAVVSGGPRVAVTKSIKHVELDDVFKHVLTADDPIPPKPAPDLFLEAARRMGVAPEDCLVFEDGIAGMKGASEAGMEIFDVKTVYNC